jgi:hypothetical protein
LKKLQQTKSHREIKIERLRKTNRHRDIGTKRDIDGDKVVESEVHRDKERNGKRNR